MRWPHALLSVVGLLLTLTTRAQQGPSPVSFFTDDAAARRAATTAPLAAALTAARALTLDETGLRTALTIAPLESKGGASPLVITLPLPDGTSARFAVREAPVMTPE